MRENDEKRCIAVSSYASAVITNERLEILDENGELIAYESIDYLTDEEIEKREIFYTKLLLESDYDFATYLFSTFDDVILIGKFDFYGYSNIVNCFGQEYVNKIGDYYLVLNE